MKKKIIIISVTMLFVGTLSTVSAIFLPKYMKHSFAIVASDGVDRRKSGETISNSEKTDIKKTESSQSVVSRKAQSEQSSDVSISGNKSATARTSEASKAEEQHIEKVTKFYKPAVKIGCSSTDMKEKMFYDGQSGKTLPYRIYLPKGAGGSKKLRFCCFCTVRANVGAIISAKFVILKMPLPLREILLPTV